jgi:hypothetical protein
MSTNQEGEILVKRELVSELGVPAWGRRQLMRLERGGQSGVTAIEVADIEKRHGKCQEMKAASG